MSEPGRAVKKRASQMVGWAGATTWTLRSKVSRRNGVDIGTATFAHANDEQSTSCR